MEEGLNAIFTDRYYHGAKKIMDILSADADAMTVFGTAVELGRQAANEDGAGYPEKLNYEALGRAGADWHIFPNCVTLPWFDGALFYRARPDQVQPHNPDKCMFEICSLKRFAPGTPPKVETRIITDPSSKTVCLILDQDIVEMTEVQARIKSIKFEYARSNPVRELKVVNFHRV